jgi:hypothetical protein
MGAWDVGTFDNDTACDWAYGLEGEPDTGLVAETLAEIITVGAEYLDADAACEGLAAAEVVARLRGNWGERNAYTETVDNWVESHPGQPPAELVSAALAAIGRVLTEPSELLELWSETEDFGRWRDGMEELRRRVSG